MKSINLSSQHWFKLIIFIGLYFYAVQAVNKVAKKEIDIFDNYLVYKNNNGEIGWTTTSDEASARFKKCISSCPATESIQQNSNNTEVEIMFDGGNTVKHSCFLLCFFAFDMAIYRNAPVEKFNLMAFLEDSIICLDNENMAYCHALNEQDKKQKKRFSQFSECLKNAKLNLSSSPKKSSILITANQPIRENLSFQDCFFKDPTAIALRKSSKDSFLTFLERDKVPGYEVGPLTQRKRGAM